MDLRSATNDLVNQTRAYLERPRSNEGESLTEVDLQVLRIQLRLLENEVSNRQYMIKRSKEGQTRKESEGF